MKVGDIVRYAEWYMPEAGPNHHLSDVGTVRHVSDDGSSVEVDWGSRASKAKTDHLFLAYKPRDEGDRASPEDINRSIELAKKLFNKLEIPYEDLSLHISGGEDTVRLDYVRVYEGYDLRKLCVLYDTRDKKIRDLLIFVHLCGYDYRDTYPMNMVLEDIEVTRKRLSKLGVNDLILTLVPGGAPFFMLEDKDGYMYANFAYEELDDGHGNTIEVTQCTHDIVDLQYLDWEE